MATNLRSASGDGLRTERPLRILQTSTADRGGGAEGVAWNLFQAYRALGHGSWLAVGSQRSNAPDVLTIPNDAHRNRWARACINVGHAMSPLVGRIKGAGRLRNVIRDDIGQPLRAFESRRGHEDVAFPASWHVLDLPPERPDVLHCHNLHGGYFDVRALPWLSEQLPVVMTLHDAWLLSGHCAHSFDCERWQSGCGQCPDLTIGPAIRRDATAYNWLRKKNVYSRTRLYVATPSHWLMGKVEQSMLAPAIVEGRVIPYGVDLSVFSPPTSESVRASLNLPADARIILFAANGIRRNIWKDYETMRAAVSLLADRVRNRRLLFLALGDDGPAERVGRAEIRFIPFQDNPGLVTRYYQAADVYVHAARADTFPNSVLEALACGTPVVATAVGGISEQVQSLHSRDTTAPTGVLVPPGNPGEMAAALEVLLYDENVRGRLSHNAAHDARQRFDLTRQVEEYLSWYQAIVSDRRSKEVAH
jgi:glycosyltransferase involved in cell wall biosynthesis